jgi:hypothetical protein
VNPSPGVGRAGRRGLGCGRHLGNSLRARSALRGRQCPCSVGGLGLNTPALAREHLFSQNTPESEVTRVRCPIPTRRQTGNVRGRFWSPARSVTESSRARRSVPPRAYARTPTAGCRRMNRHMAHRSDKSKIPAGQAISRIGNGWVSNTVVERAATQPVSREHCRRHQPFGPPVEQGCTRQDDRAHTIAAERAPNNAHLADRLQLASS